MYPHTTLPTDVFTGLFTVALAVTSDASKRSTPRPRISWQNGTEPSTPYPSGRVFVSLERKSN